MCTPFQFGTLRNGASFLGKSANEEPPRHESPINPHEKQGNQRAKRPPAREAAHFPASRYSLLERARNNGAGQDVLEVLESFPLDEEFATLADVMKAYGGSDQAPQSGVIDIKP